MLIHEREFKDCSKCGNRQMVRAEVHGCDVCRKTIDQNLKNVEYHDATVFWHGSGDRTTRPIFCSVRCFAQWLAALPVGADVDFLSLPLFHAAQIRELQGYLAVPLTSAVRQRGRSQRRGPGKLTTRA